MPAPCSTVERWRPPTPIAVDHVQAMIDGVRKAGADLSTVADHVDRIDYLSPSEAASLTVAPPARRRASCEHWHLRRRVRPVRGRCAAVGGSERWGSLTRWG